MEMISLVMGILVALFLSGFFSGIEMAYISFDKLLLKGKIEKNTSLSRTKKILEDPSQFITFVLIGNNFCLICLSSLSTIFFQTVFGEVNEAVLGVGIVLVLTPVIVIFCELIPKNIGIVHSRRIVQMTSFLIEFLIKMTLPFIQAILFVTKILLFPLSLFLKTSSVFVTRTELRGIFDEGFQKGRMTRHSKEMIDHVFDFDRITVGQKMVSLSKVAKICIDDPSSKLKELARKTHFARFLVYGKTQEEILGFVNIYDVLFDEGDQVTIKDHLRTPIFLKEDTTLHKALEKLRQEREWFLVVIGKGDRAVGTLTLKRLLNF